MRIIIAGSQHCTDPAIVEQAVAASPWAAGRVSAVIEGGAEGVDRLARAWAEARGLPVTTVPADWTQGRSAGPQRNRALARDSGAEGLLLIWNQSSRGSASMLAEARKAGLPVFEYMLEPGSERTSHELTIPRSSVR